MLYARIAIVFALAAVLAATFLYTVPKKLDFTVEGVLYQLGEENRDFEQPTTIHIDGKVKRGLLGPKTFTGLINIEGVELPIPEEAKMLNLKFGKHGEADLTYRYIENGMAMSYLNGGITIDQGFSSFTIWIFERTEVSRNQARYHWSAGNGQMISAPARNREEALAITAELMGKSYPSTDWK